MTSSPSDPAMRDATASPGTKPCKNTIHEGSTCISYPMHFLAAPTRSKGQWSLRQVIVKLEGKRSLTFQL
jgi:hypothetical protein